MIIKLSNKKERAQLWVERVIIDKYLHFFCQKKIRFKNYKKEFFNPIFTTFVRVNKFFYPEMGSKVLESILFF